MSISEADLEFVKQHVSAAMITVGSDGFAKAVRIGVAFVDGKLWSSGTKDRARTQRLREDPRCTLFVFDSEFGFVTLETTVTVLDGPDASRMNLRFFRQIQKKPSGPLSWFGGEYDEDAFVRMMEDEGRVIFELDVQRTYGMH